MNTIKRVTCFSCVVVYLMLTFSVGAECKISLSLVDQILDSYGKVSWEEEKARLDNFAAHLQENPDDTGYIFVYAGRRACPGEAQTHAIRAKKYVVEVRGIEASRVVWRDGGYRENFSVGLHLSPSGMAELPVVPTIDQNEVEILDCKGKKISRRKRGRS